LEERLHEFQHAELNVRLDSERLDVTLPGRRRHLGRRHVVLQLLDEVVDILMGMGFSVQTGPDIERDYYNFEALNFPKDHPSRDMQDTFYVESDILMRTHTSNVQVRVMENEQPPIRAIAFGKCYRNEDISSRSHVLFHQVEGFYIDRHVTFADLFATLKEFFSKLFKKEVKMRYRPSYFPFVEPGMEVDVHCFLCDGKGCSVCKKTGFLEVAGAGMVHPEVMKNSGIDPDEYSGYAWALGIERLAMLRYGIPDIRLFMENNRRFLEQF
jgi:phenylalanyl-tRNA synthetase alpha chain